MTLKIGQTNGRREIETEGVWVNIVHDAERGFVWWLDHEPPLTEDGEPDGRIRVARAGNPKARAFSRKSARKYRNLARRSGGDLPDHIVMEQLRKQYAQTILLDWEGVEIEGEEPDYDPDLGERVFEADPDFLDTVINIANEAQAFRSDEIAEDAEAVGNVSSGKPDGAPTSTSSEPQESS